MSASTSAQVTKVSFSNQLTSIAGLLFTPPNMDETKKHPALAVAHHFGGAKEQTAGIYAGKMAEKGYVTLAFDASHQGPSGGYPRDTENPAERIEDIRCVCAGGSYVMAVAPTEMRAKAIASVSLWDLRLTAREGGRRRGTTGLPFSWKSGSNARRRRAALRSDGTTAFRKTFQKALPGSIL